MAGTQYIGPLGNDTAVLGVQARGTGISEVEGAILGVKPEEECVVDGKEEDIDLDEQPVRRDSRQGRPLLQVRSGTIDEPSAWTPVRLINLVLRNNLDRRKLLLTGATLEDFSEQERTKRSEQAMAVRAIGMIERLIARQYRMEDERWEREREEYRRHIVDTKGKISCPPRNTNFETSRALSPWHISYHRGHCISMKFDLVAVLPDVLSGKPLNV